MCGRYGLFDNLDDLGTQLGFDPAAVRAAYLPRWNIAPTTPALVVESVPDVGRLAQILPWGGQPQGRHPRFNIRQETIAQWNGWHGGQSYRRCLVPANGFYEWQAGPGKHRTPWWFQPPDGNLIFLAGIRFGAGDDASYAVITCPANDLVKPVHHRMPVTLSATGTDEWLDGAEPTWSLLKSQDEPELAAWIVSTAVNRAGNDGPDLIVPSLGDNADSWERLF